MDFRRPSLIGSMTFAVFAGAFLLGLVPTAIGHSLEEKIAEEERALSRMKKQISDEEKRRDLAARKEGSILGELERLDRVLATRKKEADAVAASIRRSDQEIRELDQRVALLRGRIESLAVQVRYRLRSLYQSNRLGIAATVFSSPSYSELLRTQYYLETISRRDSQMITNYKLNLEELKVAEAKAREIRSRLVEDQSALSARLKEIDGDRRTKNRLLARVRDDREAHDSAARELRESAARVSALVSELQARRRTEDLATKGFGKAKGRLEWPATGHLVALFGRQKHPKFDTFVFKKGIEIRASSGDPIRSVYDGVVVFSDWFRGYGLLLILDHGENYYSLYAHAAKLLVSVGDRVRGNQVIGEVGETGISGDSNLYFEIRRGGDALDPVPWLKKR